MLAFLPNVQKNVKRSSNASLLAILSILFGGYAISRKYVVFSRLLLNSYMYLNNLVCIGIIRCSVAVRKVISYIN
jgi:hypothetical protein